MYSLCCPVTSSLAPRTPSDSTSASPCQSCTCTTQTDLRCCCRNCFTACRKVFGLLSAQLVLTALVAAPIVMHSGVKAYVMTSPWVTMLAMVGSLVLLMTLSFSESARNTHPTNLVLLAAFTCAEGVLVGAITSQYQLQAILLAVAMTAAITVALTAYALTTKRDFTLQGGMLCALLCSLLLAGLLGVATRSPALQLLLAGGGAALFGCYIVYDVQMIAGGKHTAMQLSPDEYVVGAIQVYLDVVNLFLHLLRFISEMQRES
ncbi:inhibitor of apoptosis-promoting Bax1-domain-containing protein [Scenedesmus sp. NREL 46B-D3]|nr:inhibitor of apoptosis-promoting Bax1-domain-containing protein [Scenedesmus sp. NREL 46B-D3]